ncbi:MAG: hypothetical protein ACOYVK_10530, partial [Bacillota bacterium]
DLITSFGKVDIEKLLSGLVLFSNSYQKGASYIVRPQNILQSLPKIQKDLYARIFEIAYFSRLGCFSQKLHISIIQFAHTRFNLSLRIFK